MTIDFPYKVKAGAGILWFVFLPAVFVSNAAYPWLADIRTALIGNINVPERFMAMVALGMIVGAVIISRWLHCWLLLFSVAVLTAAFFYS